MKPILNLNDIIEWDIPNWSVALEYWNKHTNLDLLSSYGLEIGSRNGGLSLWAALKGIHVLCTDIQPPQRIAIEKHNIYGVSHLVKYETLDVLNIKYSGKFNVAFFKSLISSLKQKDKQAMAINEIHKSLAQGGELWFAENLLASPFHQFLRKRYVEWGQCCRYVTIQEMKDFLSIFSEVHYTTVGFLGCLGRSSFQRTILGAIDRVIADKSVPESWRYIILGIARR